MNEDTKMFQIGIWSLVIVAVLTVLLQAGYRTQNRVLNHVHRSIVQVKKDIAATETDFAAYVRPEILGNAVKMVYPRAEIIDFQKNVAINNLPEKK